jgi:hypothetical protein
VTLVCGCFHGFWGLWRLLRSYCRGLVVLGVGRGATASATEQKHEAPFRDRLQTRLGFTRRTRPWAPLLLALRVVRLLSLVALPLRRGVDRRVDDMAVVQTWQHDLPPLWPACAVGTACSLEGAPEEPK